MAGYSYAGLRIAVNVDTRGMEQSIRNAARGAASSAGKTIEDTIGRAADRAGSAFTRSMTQAGQRAGQSLASTARAAGGLFERVFSAALGGIGGKIASVLWNAVRPVLAEAAKRTAAQLFLDALPTLRRGVDGFARTIGQLAVAARRTAQDMAAAFRSAVTWIGNALNSVVSVAGRVAAVIAQGMISAARAAGNAWRGLGGIGSVLASGFARAFDAVLQAAGRAASLVSGTFGRAFSAMASLGGQVSGTLGRAFDQVATVAGRAASMAGTAWHAMVRTAQTLFGALSSAFQAVASVIQRIATAIANAVTRAARVFSKEFAAAANQSAGSIMGIVPAFRNAGEDIGRVAETASATLANGFLDGAESAAQSVLGIKPAVDEVGAAAERTGERARMAFGAFGEIARSVGAALASAGTIAAGAMVGLGAKVVSTGVGFNSLNQSAGAAFTTMLGSREAADQMMDRITEFANSSPFPREAFIEGTQQMIGFGVETDRVIPYLSALQDAVAANGRGAQDLSELTLVMSQIQAAGRITGVDLMQFAQRGIDAAELIGNAMGKTGKEIQSEITSGSLDATTALDALANGMDQRFGGAAANLKGTWVGAQDTVRASMRNIGAAIVEPFISRGGGGLAVEWANRLSNALKGLVPVVKPLATAFANWLAPPVDRVLRLVERMSKSLEGVDPGTLVQRFKQLGPVIGIAAGGFALMSGQMLSQIPVVGNLLGGLTGPAQAIGKQFGTVAQQAAKTLVPALGSTIGEVGGLGGALGGVAAPLLAVGAGFAALMVASPKFRESVMGLVRALGGFFKPVLDAVIEGFKTIIPPIWDLIRQLGDQLSPIIDRLTPLLRPLGELLASTMKMAFAELAAVIKFLMPVLSLLINVIGTGLVWALNIIVPVLQFVITVFKAVVDAITWVWHWIVGASPGLVPAFQLLAAIVTAAVGFIGNLCVTVFNAIRAAIVAVWNAITTAAVWAWGQLKAIVTGAVGMVRWIVTSTWNAILAATRAVWNGILIAVQTVWTWIRTAVSAAAGFVRWVVTTAWGFILAATRAVWNAIVWTVQSAWNWIRAAVSAAAGFVRWAVSAAWNFILAVTRAVWAAIAGTISAAWNGIRGAVAAAIGWIRSFITAAWNWIRAVTVSLWNGIRDVVAGALNAIRNAVHAALSWVGSRIRDGWSWVRGITVQLWTAIFNAIRSAWDWIKSAIGAALSWIGDRIRSGWDWIRGTTARIWSAILGGIRSTWDGIKNVCHTSVNWVRDRLSQTWDNIRNTAKSAWEGVVRVIRAAWDGVKKAVGTPVFFVADKILRPLLNGINKVLKVIPGIPEVPTGWIDSIPHFRRGGRVPGGWGGGDRQPIMAEPGEWVLTKHQARAIGYSRLASLPRYRDGGLVTQNPLARDLVPQWMKNVAGRVVGGLEWLWDGFKNVKNLDGLFSLGKKLWDDVTGFLRMGTSEMLRELTAPMRKMVEPYKDDPNVMKQFMHGITTQVLDSIINFIAGKEGMGAGGIVPLAMSFDGHRYVWGGPANPQQGWDCSSFINFLAGSVGLPLPGGFKAPSHQHGPVTTDWLSFGGMQTIGHGAMDAGDIAVNPQHIILVTGKGGQGFAARSTATGTGPQRVTGAYTIRRWPGMTPEVAMGAGGPGGSEIPGGDAIKRWAPLVTQIANMHGIPHTVNAWLSQIKSESGGNPNAIQRVMDVNMRNGNPARGLLQVIPTTFAAQRGNPFGNNIMDPRANIWAAMNYAKNKWGGRLLNFIGHGHGYANGGIIREPVVGWGVRSGERYEFAERGPELVSPLRGDAPGIRRGGAGGTVINVYPQRGQDERRIAAAVSRELAWAQAGGAR